MVCCPNTGNYVGASHRECKNKNEIIGPKWYQQPSIADNKTFKETVECMYCKEKDMLNIGLSKVRDHCHISGKYRGPAHSDCNKKLQMGDLKTKVLAKIATFSNKNVTIDNIVDPSIIGGFIIRIGDMQYNASIANRLQVLKRELSN